jgi:hypothetical protein
LSLAAGAAALLVKKLAQDFAGNLAIAKRSIDQLPHTVERHIIRRTFGMDIDKPLR